MKSTIQNATTVLGPELVRAFHESCRGNKREMEELINEAIRALNFVKRDDDWNNETLIDIE